MPGQQGLWSKSDMPSGYRDTGIMGRAVPCSLYGSNVMILKSHRNGTVSREGFPLD